MPMENAPFQNWSLPVFEPGSVFAVGTYDFGPFNLSGYEKGVLVDITRSDDGTNGTATLTVFVDDAALGLVAQLDGAGATVAINDWAAGENVRRVLQIHPTAGPIPSSDADGVFAVGTTGVASTYFRQPVLCPLWLRLTVATDASTFSSATIYFLP